MGLEGKPPFAAVLTNGFGVDGQGRKMSKSLGNVISPEDVIKNNGVDILRLWVASSNYNDDVRLSNEILERLIDAYRKIRNTMRYLLGNLAGFIPDQHTLNYKELMELDKLALGRLGYVANAVRKAYEKYEFAKVYQMIYSFCNDDLSGFYLDILKDRLLLQPLIHRKDDRRRPHHIFTWCGSGGTGVYVRKRFSRRCPETGDVRSQRSSLSWMMFR